MSQTYPILLNLLAAIIGALGQYCYKLGSQKLKDVPIYENWQIMLGVFLFSFVMILFIWSFKIGGRISVTFPFYATTFIWGTLLGIFLDKEAFNWIQGIGIVCVVVGISIIAAFGRH
jgi:drug/metabolite transporter (DMT)-like permease